MALGAGTIDAAEVARINAHLADCDACRSAAAEAQPVKGSTVKVGLAGPSGGGGPKDRPGDDHDGSGQHSSAMLLQPGDIVSDKYKVEHLLGRGGTGQVFAALHVELGHRVAIKLPYRSDSTSGARFMREAQTCARLASDHIVRVFDVGHLANGLPYIVMECLAGEDLARVIARGPVAASQAAGYVLEACVALREAHAAGVVHRDLKPANLFLARRKDSPPVLKVLDFGISKFAPEESYESELALTPTGAVLGSPLYMSPEQIRANRDVDARTDIWSLGVILHELLSGHPPFRADTLTALSVIIATEPPHRLSSTRADLPPGLVTIVSRCLEKDRAGRFPSVEALMEAIAPFAPPEQAILARRRTEILEAEIPAGRARENHGQQMGPKHNLPAQTTPFIGREKELNELGRLLTDPRIRLVTIVAPGGMGKSRLALEAGRRLWARVDAHRESEPLDRDFAHGVFLVQLAPLQSAEFVLPAIAQSVGLQFRSGVDPKQQLVDYFREKRLLLLIDNFEHVLPSALVVSDALEAAPGVKMLITSRERLNLSGETLFPLTGMDVPDQATTSDPLDFGAMRLFVESARRVHQKLELGIAEYADIAQICRLVEGTPLGIVLAASWARVLSLREIAREIGESLDFLETEMRDVAPRQRSIRAVFEHSWKLLTDDERRAFSRLSVFRGGFTRDAARVVARTSLRTIAGLANKSLLRPNPDNTRYEVHELLRQYAEARLRDSPPDYEDAVDAHSSYYAEFLHERGPTLKACDLRGALDEIQMELDNVRAAWAHMLAQKQVANVGKAMESLNHFCWHRASSAQTEATFDATISTFNSLEKTDDIRRIVGLALAFVALCRGRRGRAAADMADMLKKALGLLEENIHPRERAFVLLNAGLTMARAGNLEESIRYIERGLALYRTIDDRWGVAQAIHFLGRAHDFAGNFGEAERYYRESIAAQQSADERTYMLPVSLSCLGFLLCIQGKYAEGCQLMEEALRLDEKAGSIWSQLRSQAKLANAHRQLGNYAVAEKYIGSYSALAREVGSLRYEAESHLSLGVVLKEQGRHEEAAVQLEVGYRRSVEYGNIATIAVAKLQLGDMALIGGRRPEAKQYYTESLTGFEAAGTTWGIVLALDSMGYLACTEQAFHEAGAYFRRALDLAMRAKLPTFAFDVVAGFALLHARQGHGERAVELLAMVKIHPATERQTHTRLVEPLLTELMAKLPSVEFDAALERGKALELGQVARDETSAFADDVRR